MNRFFGSTTTIIIPLILAPFTLLLILSQNTVPGDLLYPYKRGVEIMVLAAASLNPETRVAFRTDLTEKRFNEAEILLLAKQDVAALETFLQEVRETETAITNVPNVQKKEELKQTLIAKIDDYQIRLTQIETKVQTGGNIPPPQGGSFQNQDNSFPTSTPVPAQQDIPTAEAPTSEPEQVVPTPILPVDVGVAIDSAKEELERIKERSKRDKEKEKEEEEREGEERKERKNSDEHDKDDDDKKSNKRGVDKERN